MTRRLSPAALLVLLSASPGVGADRKGDEIVVCGRYVHVGVPVVTWMDPGGYDASDRDRRFPEEAKPGDPPRVKECFGFRKAKLPPETIARVKAEGWDLPTLREAVDQFVIHFDARGTSRECFRILHDVRGLSVHFMLDLDGTIYQTLDLKEGAWHATKANGRSIGVEVANVGAVPRDQAAATFAPWYKRVDGRTVLEVPGPPDRTGLRDRSLVPMPSRPEPVVGVIHGRTIEQYDYTPRQYDSLIKLTAALHATFPKIGLDYPRGEDGKLLLTKLPDLEYDRYAGVLGHYHVQTNKVDPGPAFQWDRLIDGARAIVEASR